MKTSCEREAELLELVGTGAWPNRADADLRSHVAECGYCRELASVILAFSDARVSAGPSRIPDARLVWHRAQMLARQESARRAARPVVFAQIAMGAVVVALVLLWTDPSWFVGRVGADGDMWVSALRGVMGPVQRVFEPISSIVPSDDQAFSPMGYAFVVTVGISVAVLGAAAGVSRLIDRWS
jgi:hypothetical protein